MNELIKKISGIKNKEELLELINSIGSLYESGLLEKTKKKNGIYYTALPLAKHMVDELLMEVDTQIIETLKFLEPCVGTGNFVFAYLLKIHEMGLTENKIINIINNIYVSDTDSNALIIYKAMLEKIVEILFNIDIEKVNISQNISNGLLVDINNDELKYTPIETVYPEVMKNGGFDIIITNPPYKNLKVERNKYSDSQEYIKDKELYERISNFTKSHFNYVNNGVTNIYKLFVEEIVCSYASKKAVISLLIPSTILTDKSCSQIRKYLLINHNIKKVNVVEEGSNFVNAQQALSSLLIHKNHEQGIINLNKNFTLTSKGQYSEVDKKFFLNEDTDYSIFTLSKEEYSIMEKLRNNPTINSLNFIHNKRGELDLTLDKSFITKNNTQYKLIRGRHINYYQTKLDEIDEYVLQTFIEKSSKADSINRERIICQQIANMKKHRRLTFSYIGPKYILANSCNYLTIDKNKFGLDLFALLGIMNSTIINWLFKVTSSNNHINNYEIDMLPIPINSSNLSNISRLTKEYINTGKDELLEQIDYEVNDAYELEKSKQQKNKLSDDGKYINQFVNDFNTMGLGFQINRDEAVDLIENKLGIQAFIVKNNLSHDKFISQVVQGLVSKYQRITKNQILNHNTSKLSDLDMEMIKDVPQGGNWKNISKSVVEKSKRLKRIAETGGRTTLYGRIDYLKPSYTITTYFNRPGNGTYIHPIHDRVISFREAARLQSFPDDYYFFGSKTDLLKQIGNAVPPILAYQIGSNLKKLGIHKNAIDLFAGAGGLTVGLKNAGIHSIASVDNFEKSCVTLKLNNPEIRAICGDIKDQDVKSKLYNIVKGKDVDLICGGPPCQGFSYAGKRFVDDPRNSLFKEYVEIVSVIKPKVMVLENVPGMLTLDKGKIYEQILELFSSLGYIVEGKLLIASDYAVPQKRKRLIIIGVRKDLKFSPRDIFPTQKYNRETTSLEAIGDLENVICSESSIYLDSDNNSLYIKAMKGEITIDEYLRSKSFDVEEEIHSNEATNIRSDQLLLLSS